jgi:FtsP/CotA-like multicopper oxidase with cupredoxin domain
MTHRARLLSAFFLFATLEFVACAHRDAAAPLFPEQPELAARNGVVHVQLAAVRDPHTLQPTFSYAGTLGAAPTLRVHPGDRIEIDYRNALDANDPMGNATNLHFHGLVTAPVAPGDETLHTLALPGQSLHYVVDVSPHQQPGLYWYHPHAHGNTFRQVGLGGMSGAIVVEGLQRAHPDLAALRERLLVVRDVADDLETNILHDHPELARPSEENSAGNQPCLKIAGTHVTLNGVTDAKIPIAAGETQFFRMLNATASRFLDVSLGRATLSLVALDGVALDAYPGAPSRETLSHVVIPPGGRAEFTVTGAKAGDHLRTACYDSGPDGDPDPSEVLATVVDDANASMANAPAPASPLVKPVRNPLAGPIPAPVRDRVVRFTEENHNGANVFRINDTAYAMGAKPMFVAKSGTIERWTIVNATREVHAFHIHQVHFAVQSIDGKPQARYWRDSFTTPPGHDGPGGAIVPTKSIVLVDFRDPIVRGTFVFHCHLLDHEDLGMMASIMVK